MDIHKQLEEFVCRMYAPKAETSSVNELRYQLFCSKQGHIEPHQLPPCAEALKKHTERANYPSLIWRSCMKAQATIPPPNHHGWKLESSGEDFKLVIDWLAGSVAPESLSFLISCKCSKSCKEWGKCMYI